MIDIEISKINCCIKTKIQPNLNTLGKKCKQKIKSIIAKLSMLTEWNGEIIIDVKGKNLSGLIPVIVLDLSANPAEVSLRNW